MRYDRSYMRVDDPLVDFGVGVYIPRGIVAREFLGTWDIRVINHGI